MGGPLKENTDNRDKNQRKEIQLGGRHKCLENKYVMNDSPNKRRKFKSISRVNLEKQAM
jgi:hypothetical protein